MNTSLNCVCTQLNLFPHRSIHIAYMVKWLKDIAEDLKSPTTLTRAHAIY